MTISMCFPFLSMAPFMAVHHAETGWNEYIVDRGVHSIVRRLRTNPPREINLVFFFFFAFSHRGLVSHKWIESEWVWQAFFCETRTQKIGIVKLEENCGGGLGGVGRGPGHPSRSRSPEARCERGAQGKAVRVVEAMWRSVAIKARLSKRKECLGGRL